jgi:hypothetical protein
MDNNYHTKKTPQPPLLHLTKIKLKVLRHKLWLVLLLLQRFSKVIESFEGFSVGTLWYQIGHEHA